MTCIEPRVLAVCLVGPVEPGVEAPVLRGFVIRMVVCDSVAFCGTRKCVRGVFPCAQPIGFLNGPENVESRVNSLCVVPREWKG